MRQQSVEQRADGPIVHIEVTPGVVTTVAAWMLDPAACVGMEIGLPRVALAALIDLHRLLRDCGFAPSSPGDFNIIPEVKHEEAVDIDPTVIYSPPSVEYDARLHADPADERLGARDGTDAVGAPLDAGRRRPNRGAR